MAGKIRIYLLFVFALLLFVSCSKFYQFDELYDRGEYLKAYGILSQIEQTNNPSYRKRYYRIVIKLSLDGDKDFVLKLSNMINANDWFDADVMDYYYFSRGFLSYVSASDTEDYNEVLSYLSNIIYIPEEFSSYYSRITGISYYKLGDYQRSISNLMASYKKMPYLENLYYTGMSYYNLYNYEKALEYFEDIIETSSDRKLRSLARYQKGEILYYRQDYTNAYEEYLYSLNDYSLNPDCSYKIAKCLQKMDYSKIQLEFLKIALRVDKDYANAWFMLNAN